MTFTQDLTKSGKNKGGNALEQTINGHHRSRAQRQDRGDGRAVRGDQGAARRILLVEAKDLDEAISIAARIPSSKYGSTEVRPVMKINM